ncbi:hypothetical protein ACFLRR_03730 [Bacteroidota bacterium]
MEYIGYFLLAIVLICWIIAVAISLVAAFPWGLIGFVGIAGFGFLFAKVVKDRLENKEDDHYSKNVEK